MKIFNKPCIFAANHETFYDGPALFSYLRLIHKVKLVFVVKEEIIRDHFVWRFFINKINYTIVKKEKPSEVVAETAKLLKEGYSIIIFPEGKTYKKEEGSLLRGKTGVIRIALEEKVPIIPTGIIYFNKRKPFKFTRKICFGDPFYAKPFNSYQGLRRQTDRLMEEIATLSNRKY